VPAVTEKYKENDPWRWLDHLPIVGDLFIGTVLFMLSVLAIIALACLWAWPWTTCP
jgi:hypothetical protein